MRVAKLSILAPGLIIGALFASENTFPPLYYHIKYTCLFLSVLALPLGYALLYFKMRRSKVPKPPNRPFFFIFGTVGGYLLIVGLSPSIFNLLIFPLFLLAPISLLWSIVYMFYCRPLTGYHKSAILLCSLLIFVNCLLLFL